MMVNSASASLPEAVRAALEPLYSVLPPDRAMPDLVPSKTADSEAVEAVRRALLIPAFRDDLSLQAGLWLYVDDLDASHRISQSLPDSVGAYWHAMMHRREGDFGNSKYWLRAAGSVPEKAGVGFDPFAFVDEVALRHRENPVDLVRRQREEWRRFFAWCASAGARTEPRTDVLK